MKSVSAGLSGPTGESLYQFLLEAVLISGSGATVGILLAVGLRFPTESLLPGNLSIPISWLSGALASAASCSMGVLFGYLPARKAAGLLLTESLAANKTQRPAIVPTNTGRSCPSSRTHPALTSLRLLPRRMSASARFDGIGSIG